MSFNVLVLPYSLRDGTGLGFRAQAACLAQQVGGTREEARHVALVQAAVLRHLPPAAAPHPRLHQPCTTWAPHESEEILTVALPALQGASSRLFPMPLFQPHE